MNEIKKKLSFTNVTLIILAAMLVGTAILYGDTSSKLSEAYADIMNVESISSTTQRQVCIAAIDSPQQREVFVINDNTSKALSIDGSEKISLMSDPTIAVLANEVLEQWKVIEEIISVNWNLEEGEDSKEINVVALGLARDAHFKAMTDLSNAITDYTHDLNDQIQIYQFCLSVLGFLIAVLLFNRGLQTTAELSMSKELAEQAQIDTATGLYNRSRCQDLFKVNHAISEKRSPAFMVLDLNDLKKTNDSLGHRVGDELIGSFALILKKAGNIHSVPPFIGRYGGDEFIVYYEDIPNEDELTNYLKELEFLTNEQNERESRFQVSYAAGYSFASKDSAEELTPRQLFDKADEAMYINKVEGKRAKNPNYDAEKAKGEVR